VLAHERSRLDGRSLEHDRPGDRAADHGCSVNPFQPRADVRRKERISFARAIAERLHDGLKADAFASLTLIAAAPFIGELRAALSGAVAVRVQATLTSDLTHVGLAQLRARVPDARPATP
jgi:protein required for attachment to host cells